MRITLNILLENVSRNFQATMEKYWSNSLHEDKKYKILNVMMSTPPSRHTDEGRRNKHCNKTFERATAYFLSA